VFYEHEPEGGEPKEPKQGTTHSSSSSFCQSKNFWFVATSMRVQNNEGGWLLPNFYLSLGMV
jgi:hypothetical protein